MQIQVLTEDQWKGRLATVDWSQVYKVANEVIEEVGGKERWSVPDIGYRPDEMVNPGVEVILALLDQGLYRIPGEITDEEAVRAVAVINAVMANVPPRDPRALLGKWALPFARNHVATTAVAQMLRSQRPPETTGVSKASLYAVRAHLTDAVTALDATIAKGG